MASAVPRYRAFLSYSHSDRARTAWLHRALETYHLPPRLTGAPTRFGPAPKRLTPIFRDRDELAASGDLGGELKAALQASMFLIVICSPAAAASRWVNEEVLSFKRLHGEDRVLALIVGGEPYASGKVGRELEECFPRALRFQLGPDGELSDVPAEPIAADMRPGGDGRRLAKLKLIAGLVALPLADLVQREEQRRMRRLIAVAAAASAGMVFAGALAIYANARRIEADQERQIAERESATARATSDFLIGSFSLANPATDNPRTITALTILKVGADRASAELAGQPAVQARLIATLAQAYNNLGLYSEARDAVEHSMPAVLRAGPDGVSALLTLADSYLLQGLFERALATTKRAVAALGPDPKAGAEQRARAAVIESQVWTNEGDTVRGLAAVNLALALYRSMPNKDDRRIAVALNSRGLLLNDDGDLDAARTSLAEALEINRRVLGEQHLDTGQSWYALALNDFSAGRLSAATAEIDNALTIERRVLEPDNTIIAGSLQLRGRILQGEHRLAEAEADLEQSIAIYRKRFGKPHFMIGITEVYLALVQSDRGEFKAALANMDDAQHNYDVSYGKIHPNDGDLLVNRATVLAKAGRPAEARRDCAAGLKILDDTLGPSANYTKTMAQTCAKLRPRTKGEL
jgi:tetratricopeptide (TPR) repeat protein